MPIRPFVPQQDMAAMVAIMNQINPLPVTVEELLKREQQDPEGMIRLRVVFTDQQGEVLGYGGAVHVPHRPAGHFTVRVIVDPAARSRGIGSALFEESMRLVKEAGGKKLIAWCREDHPEAFAWAQRRGFRLDRHAFASTLPLAAFDEAPFAPAVDAAEARGLRFLAYADVPDTAANRRKLYELEAAIDADMPGFEPPFMPFDEWEKVIFTASWFRPEGQIIAADGDRWTGLAAIGLHGSVAYHNGTGVLREYRGQQVATALKVLAIRAAGRLGATSMRTNNDSTNAPMLAINRKFGYIPEPGEYWIVREDG